MISTGSILFNTIQIILIIIIIILPSLTMFTMTKDKLIASLLTGNKGNST